MHTHTHTYTHTHTQLLITSFVLLLVLQGHLKKFKEDVQDMNTKILQAALALHDKVSSTFRKTAINFHYEFTVRHLANVFQVSEMR